MGCVWCVLLVDYVRLRGHDGVGGSLRDCNTAVGAAGIAAISETLFSGLGGR